MLLYFKHLNLFQSPRLSSPPYPTLGSLSSSFISKTTSFKTINFIFFPFISTISINFLMHFLRLYAFFCFSTLGKNCTGWILILKLYYSQFLLQFLSSSVISIQDMLPLFPIFKQKESQRKHSLRLTKESYKRIQGDIERF